MCLAFPGKIKSIRGRYAQVDFGGVCKKINVELLENAEQGDCVMVHAGYAIEKVSDENALETINLLGTKNVKGFDNFIIE